MLVEIENDTNRVANINQDYVTCANAYYPPCERYQYQITITIDDGPSASKTGGENNLTTQLNFILSNVQSMIVYEQVPTYNAHSFIGNIGGQLGLR